MSDVSADTTTSSADASPRDDQSSGPAGGSENPSFAAEDAARSAQRASDASIGLAKEAAGRTLETAKKAQAAGIEIHREATDTGREMVRAGQRAVGEASDIWRNAFQPLNSVQMEMSRLFEDSWCAMTGMSALGGLRPVQPLSSGVAAILGAPATDLRETSQAYKLCLELPGLEQGDVKVTLRDGLLVVSGSKGESRDEDAGAYRISERRYGRFERAFPVPENVQRDAVEAKLQNGVLSITLPKTAETAGDWRSIEIKG